MVLSSKILSRPISLSYISNLRLVSRIILNESEDTAIKFKKCISMFKNRAQKRNHRNVHGTVCLDRLRLNREATLSKYMYMNSLIKTDRKPISKPYKSSILQHLFR